jgi:hypothetical protein
VCVCVRVCVRPAVWRTTLSACARLSVLPTAGFHLVRRASDPSAASIVKISSVAFSGATASILRSILSSVRVDPIESGRRSVRNYILNRNSPSFVDSGRTADACQTDRIIQPPESRGALPESVLKVASHSVNGDGGVFVRLLRPLD